MTAKAGEMAWGIAARYMATAKAEKVALSTDGLAALLTPFCEAIVETGEFLAASNEVLRSMAGSGLGPRSPLQASGSALRQARAEDLGKREQRMAGTNGHSTFLPLVFGNEPPAG